MMGDRFKCPLQHAAAAYTTVGPLGLRADQYCLLSAYPVASNGDWYQAKLHGPRASKKTGSS